MEETILHKKIENLKEENAGLKDDLEKVNNQLIGVIKRLEKSNREHDMEMSWRKLVESALRHSGEQYRTLVENMGEGICVVDLNERFTYSNERGEQILGISPGGIVGRSLFEFIDEKSAHLIKEQTIKRIKGETSSYELNIRTDSGENRWLLVTSVPYPSTSGEIRHILGIFRDITSRKTNETKVEQYKNQLQELASEIILTEEKERRKISQILHDGNGQNLALVLNLMKQFRSRLKIDCEMVEIEKSINIIEDTIKNTRTLIYDLSPPTLYKFGLQYAIDELFEKFEENWKIKSEWFCSVSKLELSDDMKILLFQSVKELLVNIAKYSKATLVRGYLHMIDKRVIILIEDNGVGFDSTILDSTTKLKGFGLFSIGERLKPFDGKITIDSTLGKGTQIKLDVPGLHYEEKQIDN
jgi:PAS domain S-box-containing protein